MEQVILRMILAVGGSEILQSWAQHRELCEVALTHGQYAVLCHHSLDVVQGWHGLYVRVAKSGSQIAACTSTYTRNREKAPIIITMYIRMYVHVYYI